LLAAIAIGVAPASAIADERVTIGGFAGAHLFSETIELGNFDDSNEDTPRNSLAFGLRVGYQLIPRLRIEGELATMPTKTRQSKDDITVFGWRTQALVDLMPNQRLRPFAVAGIGFLTGAPADTDRLDEDTDLATHVGFGAEFDVTRNVSLRMDARALFVPTTSSDALTADYEFFFGVVKRFAQPRSVIVPDKDGDGVHDDDDACPEAVEDQDGYMDEDGCPDPDNDGDGVLDADDQCPAEAESANGVDDEDGCPEPDGDGDGVVGNQDACPQEAEDMDGDADEDGCPDLAEPAPLVEPAPELPEQPLRDE
tara:strand:- start:826 stop:1758 length:933 start_codon:yes stop_codon:yes gene_type:complete